MASFRSRDHFAVRALVPALRAQLPRSGGDDAGTGVCMSITRSSFALVQRYAPELEKRCRPHLKATNDSWRVDETYIKIKKTWTYLYRAVDSEGNTREFLLSPTRDAQAAKRFFLKALHLPPCSTAQASTIDEQATEPIITETRKASKPAPRVINVDKNAAYPKAIADLKALGILPESVELTSASSISTTSSNKVIASSNGWSSQVLTSSLLKRHGEHYGDMK